MKFMCIFFLLSVSVSAASYSQNAKLTLSLNDVSLAEVFSTIRKSSEFTFIFNVDDVRNIRVKSLHVREATIQQILDEALRNTGFVYRIEDSVIVIQPQDTKEKKNSVTVQGWVRDKQKVPIPGVTVKMVGVSLGTATNMKGWFSIDLPVLKGKLEFSFVGYKKLQVDFTEKTDTLKIVMEENLQLVDEVIVTGIFNKPKESFTGAVTTVTKEDIKRNFSRNLLQTLSNLDPSFHIVENNNYGSNPNALPEIQLRGASTFSNVQDLQLANRAKLNLPLFILDGFEVSLERVQDLNNEDIENITILKDASATSLYGARGANGVVVITSQVPQAGELQVNYSGTLKLEMPDLTTYDLLNTKEKLDLEYRLGAWDNQIWQQEYERLKELVDGGVDYDWLSLPVRTGVGQTHNLNITGGNEAWRFGFNLAYDKTVGVMKGSERANFNGTLNLTYHEDKWTVSESLGIGTNNNSDSPFGSFSSYAAMNPYWEPYDEEGELVGTYVHPLLTSGFPQENPAYDHYIGNWNKKRYTNVRSSTQVRYNFTQSFYLSGLFGLSRNFNKAESFAPPSHKQFAGKDLDQKGRFSRTDTESNQWNARLGLNYAKTFNEKHMLTLNASGEIEEKKEEKIQWAATGFSSDNIDFPSMAMGYGAKTRPSGSEETSRRIAMIFGLNYYYDMRYFFDASFNMNGSSSFGSESRWAPFWSVGLGWNISNEQFFIENVPFIQWLKVKASYGVSGNMGFSPDEAMAVYNLDQSTDYLSHFGAYLNKFGNPSLKWQNTYQLNLGVELRTLNERLSVEFSYYDKRTEGTVAEMLLPVSHGFKTAKANSGTIQNKGWDLKLTTNIFSNVNRGFTWSMTGSFSHTENIILEMSEGYKKYLEESNTSMYTADAYWRYREGYSMDAVYGLRTAGVDPATGNRLFFNKNGEVTFEQKGIDMVYLGNRLPKVNSNVSTTLSWKGFMLTAGFAIRLGGKQFNSTLATKTENAYLVLNQDRRVLSDTWQKPGDIVPYKRLTMSNDDAKTYVCDEFVQKDNIFQCTNINATYVFSSEFCKKLRIRGLSLGANLSDIFYVSTIKRERGTGYPFSRNPNFSLSVSF